MATKNKERDIPEDLLAMSLEQLDAEETRLNAAGVWSGLLKARDEAQSQLEAYIQRKREVTRAVLVKLEAKRKK